MITYTRVRTLHRKWVPSMTRDTVSTFIGLDKLPETIRSLSTVADVDYADLYTATTTEARDQSPEQWIRAVLEDTPLGRRARVLWRLLGLRLGPTNSLNYVQGWKIAARGDDWIRLQTQSWFLTALAVCHVDDEHLSIALFLRYDRPIAALIWTPVSVMHQQAVPVLLHQALTRHPDGASTESDVTASREGQLARAARKDARMGAEDNARLLRRAYEAFSAGDLGAATQMFSKDADWHVPGEGALSGVKHGRDEVFGYFGELLRRSGGKLRVHDVVGGVDHTVGLHHEEAERDGKVLDQNVVFVVHVREGRMTEVWEFHADQAQYDDFWG